MNEMKIPVMPKITHLIILDINTYNDLEHSPTTLCVRAANVREEHKYLYIKSACS